MGFSCISICFYEIYEDFLKKNEQLYFTISVIEDKIEEQYVLQGGRIIFFLNKRSVTLKMDQFTSVNTKDGVESVQGSIQVSLTEHARLRSLIEIKVPIKTDFLKEFLNVEVVKIKIRTLNTENVINVDSNKLYNISKICNCATYIK